MPVIRYIGSHNFISSPATTPPDEPFRIEFCNPEKKFYPGEIIEGRVVFLWSRRWKVIQGILVKLLCEGEVHYGGRPGTDTVLDRTFLCKSYYVIGDGNHDIQIQSTFAAYPFMFTLPSSGLPQSFVGPFGSVSYAIEAVARNKHHFCCATSREPFTVNEYLNLNTSIPREILAGPIAVTFDNTSSAFSLLGAKKKGDIKVTLKLTKRGFVPNEFIQFGIVVENGSRKNLPTVNIEFQQVVKFIAQLVKVDIQVLGRAAGPSVGPTSTSSWEGALEVPEVPVSSATNSISCINISYKLKIEIETGPISRNLRYEYPVIIGTIPFEHIPRRVRSLEYRRRVPLGQQRQNSQDSERPDSSTECPNYLDLAIGGESSGSGTPPPSYEDATTRKFFT